MARQIICVHVGTKYPDEYVLRLHAGCKRNIKQDFVFTVISDRVSYGIDSMRIVPVSSMRYPESRLWWHKMQAFDPAIAEDENLLLDIDVVVTGNLDKFFDHKPDQFLICQDFNRQWLRGYVRCNSSVFRFDKTIGSKIWADWSKDTSVGRHRGDQDWMDDNVANKIWWPRSWAQSWKWEVYRGGKKSPHEEKYHMETTELDPDCSILIFHGKPDPHDVTDRLVTDCWIV